MPINPYVLDFVLKPATMPFRVDFSVKAENDAKLALAENKTDALIFAEISEYQSLLLVKPPALMTVNQLLHLSF